MNIRRKLDMATKKLNDDLEGALGWVMEIKD